MGVPVRQLLAENSSYELREWMAYERHAGPLDNKWRDNMLAELHYLTQWSNFLLGAQCTGKDKKNPVPEPKIPYRPWVPEEDTDEDEESED